MKKLYEILSRAVIVFLVTAIPFVSFAQQTQVKKEDQKTTKEEPKKKVRNLAPTHSYWAVTVFGGANQFNGDLSKNLFLNDKWMFGAGAMVTKQFTRVIGARLKFGWAPLSSQVNGKYVPEGGIIDPFTGIKGDYIHQNFTSYVLEGDLHVTINFINWIMGAKPERFFSSYLIAGIGVDHTQGRKVINGTDNVLRYVGYPTHTNAEQLGIGNNSGIGKWNAEFKTVAGIGFDFNINKHWSVNPEILWRWRDGDVLDLTKGGNQEVKNDMYSGVNLGLTYKFAYGGCSLKQMQKNYSLVKFETTPAVLVEKGDSVQVTVKGTFPEKYFCQRAAMYFQPVLQYEGGSYALKPMTIMGEKVTGDGPQIKYKEGGSFTYTTIFPYKPEMANSQLVVCPTIYDAGKDLKAIPKKDDIKTKAKFVDLTCRDLAPGIIFTATRIMTDMVPLIADHGYQKEVIISKIGIIYFKINLYNLDLKFGINKTQPAKDALASLDEFIKKAWKIKDITINGWASPDGEETFNVGLSENRAKTGNTYMIDHFKSWVKDAEKNNKDKKDVKAKVDAAGKDINFVINHHGPDWNGFLTAVKASNIKDKDKILNVINSTGNDKKKEQEIRNMIVIYPELEQNLLPPLRRAEISANAYEKKFTDEELSKLAISNPDKLTVEELLYAATLASNNDTKVTIYENAAKLYPNNWKTLNNAGGADLVQGNLDKAAVNLQKAATIAPNNGIIENNLGILYAKKKDYKKAEDQFKKAQQLGENENYNLGVLMIPKGDYAKANSLLSTAKCTYNLGLAQLVSGNTSAAQTTLDCAPQTPETFYLLAICGARTNNTKMLYDNLMKAVADPKLKAEAKSDREFYNYSNTQDFKNIVK
jgi:tetratricopeptide (TPR) repeat protein